MRYNPIVDRTHITEVFAAVRGVKVDYVNGARMRVHLELEAHHSGVKFT